MTGITANLVPERTLGEKPVKNQHWLFHQDPDSGGVSPEFGGIPPEEPLWDQKVLLGRTSRKIDFLPCLKAGDSFPHGRGFLFHRE